MFWYCFAGSVLVGAASVLLVYALCKVAAGADAHIEMMQSEKEDESEK